MWATYNIALNTIDRGIMLRNRTRHIHLLANALVQIMYKLPDLQHARLLEGPAAQLGGKVAVRRLDGLVGQRCGFSEPLILQHLGGAHDRQARRVVRLHRGYEVQLVADGEGVLDDIGLVARAVAVCRARGAQNGCQER